jgi:hypothetical protein
MSRSRGTRSAQKGVKAIPKTEITEGEGSVRVSKSVTIDKVEETFHKEYTMQGLNDLINPNGPNMKITCSFDLSSKNYGNGASVMCSATIEVSQDEGALARGFEILRAVCEEEGAAALTSAQNTHRRVCGES